MAMRFRGLSKFLLPGNYTADGTDGEKVAYALELILDASFQMDRDSLEARFPSKAGESALALIGADRGIVRGRAETKEHYANRLIAWRYPRGHRVRGNAFALLEQIWEYFGGGFELHSIDKRALKFQRAADGTETAGYDAWDWDFIPLDSTNWAQFWLVIDGATLITPTPNFGDPALYGGQHGDSSYALGHDGISADDVNAIRRMFRGRAWKPAGTSARWAIISFDGSDPAGAIATNWERWARDDGSGNYIANRSALFRYWALDPTVNVYAGDPTAYPLASDMPGGGTEPGDPASFPASALLVGGPAYGGNPSNFPRSAKLVDDGSIP